MRRVYYSDIAREDGVYLIRRKNYFVFRKKRCSGESVREDFVPNFPQSSNCFQNEIYGSTEESVQIQKDINCLHFLDLDFSSEQTFKAGKSGHEN